MQDQNYQNMWIRFNTEKFNKFLMNKQVHDKIRKELKKYVPLQIP